MDDKYVKVCTNVTNVTKYLNVCKLIVKNLLKQILHLSRLINCTHKKHLINI